MSLNPVELNHLLRLNDETLNHVEKALNDYPCHVPFDHHQIVRAAIQAARGSTKLQPEIAFFLGWTISNLMANKARYTISIAFGGAAQQALHG